jgi:hypothetical protein
MLTTFSARRFTRSVKQVSISNQYVKMYCKLTEDGVNDPKLDYTIFSQEIYCIMVSPERNGIAYE